MNTLELLEKFKPEKENLIGILHELQDANPNNYLSSEDMKSVARYLNTSYSHIYGVVTYYTMFSVKPRGKYLIRVCNSPVCNMDGSVSIMDMIKSILGIDIGETTGDMLFTLEHTECLGRCSESPSLMVNKDIYGNVSNDALKSILAKYK